MGLEFSFEQLEQKLSELDKKVAKQIPDKALLKGAEVIAREQKSKVPVDSGKLQDSIIVGKPKGSVTKRKVLVGIDPSKAEEVRYGFYQEHGTKVMLGKKWMKTAWYDSAKDANKAIRESIVEDLGDI